MTVAWGLWDGKNIFVHDDLLVMLCLDYSIRSFVLMSYKQSLPFVLRSREDIVIVRNSKTTA